MFYQNLFSPQAKRSAMITTKHGIYELPHELANKLNKNENIKTSKNYSLVASLPLQMKALSILAKNSLKIEIELFPQLTQKLEFVSNILSGIVVPLTLLNCLCCF